MIMMAVIVGTALQLGEDGIGSITVGHFLDITIEFILYSGLHTSTRVLVYRSRYYLSVVYTFYVLAFDFVFYYKSERSIMGYSRSSGEEN